MAFCTNCGAPFGSDNQRLEDGCRKCSCMHSHVAKWLDRYKHEMINPYKAGLSAAPLLRQLRSEGQVIYCPRCAKEIDTIDPLAQPTTDNEGRRPYAVYCDCGSPVIATKPQTLWDHLNE